MSKSRILIYSVNLRGSLSTKTANRGGLSYTLYTVAIRVAARISIAPPTALDGIAPQTDKAKPKIQCIEIQHKYSCIQYRLQHSLQWIMRV